MTELNIADYRAEDQPWFEQLNREWIELHFQMESIDVQVLQHPDEYIIGKGGAILIARFGDMVVGTVALKLVEQDVLEFTKMAVAKEFRGKGIGKALSVAAIAKARAMGAQRIILYSNRVLTPAINLYRKLGFIEVPVDGPYTRSDIKMAMTLGLRQAQAPAVDLPKSGG